MVLIRDAGRRALWRVRYIRDYARVLVEPRLARARSAFRPGFNPVFHLGEPLAYDLGDVERYMTDARRVVGGTIAVFGREYNVDHEGVPWGRDMDSGHEWPMSFYRSIDYRQAYADQDARGERYDIKFPNEVSRFHHLLPVARGRAAALLGGATEEADAFGCFIKNRIIEWLEKNPYGFGVNWTCAMDVAIRAVNWIWMYDAGRLGGDPAFDRALHEALYLHGGYIEQNLEGDPKGSTNHYVADLVGLLAIGLSLRADSAGRPAAWLKFAAKELDAEMSRQVYPDGGHYEGSTAYQRFVLEMFAVAYVIMQRGGVGVSGEYAERLHAMFRHLGGIVKDDGSLPMVGDDDGGRVLPLGPSLGGMSAAAYTMAVGAVLFDDAGLAVFGAEACDEAVWLLGGGARADYERLLSRPRAKPGSAAYPQAGLYVMRHGDAYMCVSLRGGCPNRGHTHNDALSFVLRAGGEDLVVDPGTYVYTSDYRARNLLRSTAYHNTVRVDGCEIDDYEELELFRIRGRSAGRLIAWESTPEYDLFVGSHDGYARLVPPVIHERRIRFIKQRLAWVITDTVCSEGEGAGGSARTVEVFFHFGWAIHGVEVLEADESVADEIGEVGDFARAGDGARALIRARSAKGGCLIYVFGARPEDVRVYRAWISPRYGEREEAYALSISAATLPPWSVSYIILLGAPAA